MNHEQQNNKMIPFMDLSRQVATLEAEVEEAIRPVIRETAFSGGPFVERFERGFSEYCQVKSSAGVSNGTDALHLAIRALGIGSGDEVIVPANTFIATAWGVSHAGATPVFADCNPETWNIDPDSVKRKITAKTKAVIGVHLYGTPFQVDELKALTNAHDIDLVEDCAQAQGALYHGKKVGGLADIGCFSFYPGKNLGAFGEAGAVTSQNEALVSKVKILRNHGSQKRYYHDELGFNMRMDGIQAAILSLKLKHLDSWNLRRREIAKLYQNGIKNPKLKLQKQLPAMDSVYHLFVISVEDRNSLISHLEKHGVSTGQHYPVPCHLQKAYAHLGYREGDLPNAENQAKTCLSLPMFPELTNEEVNRVIGAINQY